MYLKILKSTAGAETWRNIPYDVNKINTTFGLQLLCNISSLSSHRGLQDTHMQHVMLFHRNSWLLQIMFPPEHDP